MFSQIILIVKSYQIIPPSTLRRKKSSPILVSFVVYFCTLSVFWVIVLFSTHALPVYIVYIYNLKTVILSNVFSLFVCFLEFNFLILKNLIVLFFVKLRKIRLSTVIIFWHYFKYSIILRYICAWEDLINLFFNNLFFNTYRYIWITYFIAVIIRSLSNFIKTKIKNKKI